MTKPWLTAVTLVLLITNGYASEPAPANLPSAPSSSESRVAAGSNALASQQLTAVPSIPSWRSSKSNSPTFDHAFKVYSSVAWGTMIADFEATHHSLVMNTGRELNPIFGSYPSRARLYGIGVPMTGILNYLAYREKKARPRSNLWKVPFIGISAVHCLGVVSNVKTW